MLLAYVLGYLALHVLVTFQPWDRYLLPVLPLIAILGGARNARRVAGAGAHALAISGAKPLAAVSAAVLLAWGSWMGVAGRLPVGSDHGAFDNLDRSRRVRAQPSRRCLDLPPLAWLVL